MGFLGENFSGDVKSSRGRRGKWKPKTSSIEGEVVHNNTPVKNFELGDAGIEDAVILRENAKPNIGKSRERGDSVEAKREKDVPMRTDATKEITPPTTPETLSDEALRDRAEKIAIMRAEILRREEDEGQAEGTPDSVKTETEMPPVSVDTEKPREEAPPVAPERPRTFDMRFASEFGVTKEMWEQIPGNEKLSVAQQKLVFENLREFNERDNAPFLKHAWEGIMEKLGRKKDVGPTLDTLSRLVESVALYGPKVHEENGELLTDFVGMEIPREHRKEWKQTFDSLNATAHRLSKTPASWQEDGIGTHSERESKMMAFMKNTLSPARKRYNEYQEIQKSYDAQKKELSRILGEAGYEPGVIAAKLVDIDKNVYGLQFQQTSPDVVETIKNVPDANMWKMIVKSLVNKSNLGYMGLGFVGRMALAGAMGVFAAPTVSAAIAGKRSWDRTAAEMREHDRAARMGTRDTSKEALNIVSAEMTIDIAGEKREVGMTHKLQSLLDEYQKLSEEESEKGETQEYKKDMSKLIDRIKVRAQYVEDKQRLNRISYGSGETHAIQMAKLYETLALAQMIVADRHVSPKSALEERLGKILFQRENVLQDKRRTRQIKEASWNALRAGSFSAAGVWLAHEAQEMGLGEKLKEFLHTQNANGLSSLEMSFLSPEEVEGGISSYPEDAPMISQRPPYTIRSGDTLTKIMREQMPEIQALEARMSQNTAIAKILKGLSAEELQRIGIRSGNPDLIYAGETINTEALHKIVVSHQSVIDEVASRASGVAKTAHEAVGEKASGELLASKPLNVAPQTIEVPKVVSVEAGELGTVSKYEYRVGIPNAGEDPNLRLSILNEATQHTERWMKLYPYASARDAVKAGIMEGHFKNLFGEQWASAGKARVTDVLTHGSRFSVGNPDRMMSEFRALVETVEKPPMNVVPMPAENMKEYIERASMAYVLRGDAISENNLIRKIEMYYVKK